MTKNTMYHNITVNVKMTISCLKCINKSKKQSTFNITTIIAINVLHQIHIGKLHLRKNW